jgi:hypothetical protein
MKKKADFWRLPNWYNTITTDLESPDFNITSLLDHKAHFGTLYADHLMLDEKPHIGHIYVLFNRSSGNLVYVGSTIAGPSTRKDYHIKDAFNVSSKNYNGRLYAWIRDNWDNADEAQEGLSIVWVRNVHLPQLRMPFSEKSVIWKAMLVPYEREFIRTIPKHRLLNTNLVDKEEKTSPVREKPDRETDPVTQLIYKALEENDPVKKLKLLKASVAVQEALL